VRRTIFVPAEGVSPIDFGITAEQRETLYQSGLRAGRDFLATWDFAAFQAACGGPAKPQS
jgi:NTE family protein